MNAALDKHLYSKTVLHEAVTFIERAPNITVSVHMHLYLYLVQ